MTDPNIHALALRLLAAEIQAPDDIPAMCLRDAADLIEAQAARMARARAALLLIWPKGEACERIHAREAFKELAP